MKQLRALLSLLEDIFSSAQDVLVTIEYGRWPKSGGVQKCSLTDAREKIENIKREGYEIVYVIVKPDFCPNLRCEFDIAPDGIYSYLRCDEISERMLGIPLRMCHRESRERCYDVCRRIYKKELRSTSEEMKEIEKEIKLMRRIKKLSGEPTL